MRNVSTQTKCVVCNNYVVFLSSYLAFAVVLAVNFSSLPRRLLLSLSYSAIFPAPARHAAVAPLGERYFVAFAERARRGARFECENAQISCYRLNLFDAGCMVQKRLR